ncbi:hypothetical protein Bca52824_023115, partial [Brassica carinata]
MPGARPGIRWRQASPPRRRRAPVPGAVASPLVSSPGQRPLPGCRRWGAVPAWRQPVRVSQAAGRQVGCAAGRQLAPRPALIEDSCRSSTIRRHGFQGPRLPLPEIMMIDGWPGSSPLARWEWTSLRPPASRAAPGECAAPASRQRTPAPGRSAAAGQRSVQRAAGQASAAGARRVPPVRASQRPAWRRQASQRLRQRAPVGRVRRPGLRVQRAARRQASAVTPGSPRLASRFAFPSNESGSFSPLYYSFNAGGAHFIVLNAYTPYDYSSDQYIWLENDLRNTNRSETSWVVATWSLPWYSTFRGHYREGESMRINLEDLLYSYQVDIVFNSQVDAYERSNRVYNYTLDQCGPVYITIGAGGAGKLETEHVDDPGNCPDHSHGSCSWFNFTLGP